MTKVLINGLEVDLEKCNPCARFVGPIIIDDFTYPTIADNQAAYARVILKLGDKIIRHKERINEIIFEEFHTYKEN